MSKSYWLIKSEPNVYSYSRLEKEGKTRWDGVRNFEARNALRGMKAGDLAFFYHSERRQRDRRRRDRAARSLSRPDGQRRRLVGGRRLAAFALKKPVTLETIKHDPALAEMKLITRSRLSVVPVSREHFQHILDLGETKKRV